MNRSDDFSACIGEGNRWSDVLSGCNKPVTAAWTGRRHDDQALNESIAQAATPTQAKRYAKTAQRRGPRLPGQAEKWDFHYG